MSVSERAVKYDVEIELEDRSAGDADVRSGELRAASCARSVFETQKTLAVVERDRDRRAGRAALRGATPT